MMDAIVDIREPTKVIRAVEDNEYIDDVKLTTLEAGDISIGGIGIERKTWPDYVSSMEDGRLAKQSDKLSEYEAAYVLIDENWGVPGDLSSTEELQHSAMAPSSIQGHIASVTARPESGVRAVIPCSNTRLLVTHAVNLARKHNEPKRSPYIPTGSVDADEPVGKQMWGCIEGIGPSLANRLYEEYESPTAYLREHPDPNDELVEIVDGLGSERWESIAEVLWG